MRASGRDGNVAAEWPPRRRRPDRRGTAVIAFSNDGQGGRAAVQTLGRTLVPIAFA